MASFALASDLAWDFLAVGAAEAAGAAALAVGAAEASALGASAAKEPAANMEATRTARILLMVEYLIRSGLKAAVPAGATGG